MGQSQTDPQKKTVRRSNYFRKKKAHQKAPAQATGQGEQQGQVKDLQRLLAIDSLDSWRAPSMDVATDSGRNNRREHQNLPQPPQRRPSGVNNSQQNRKPGKPNQNTTKLISPPQNTTTANQSATETIIPTPTATYVNSNPRLMPVFGCDANAPTYKPDVTTRSLEGEAAGSSNSSVMANGRDFWLELRKQVAALQQSGGTAQGG